MSAYNANTIVLFDHTIGSNKTFILKQNQKRLVFTYDLGDDFDYEIRDDANFDNYCDKICIIDSDGEEHPFYVKYGILSGQKFFPVVGQRSSSRYTDDDNYDVQYIPQIKKLDKDEEEEEEDEDYDDFFQYLKNRNESNEDDINDEDD